MQTIKFQSLMRNNTLISLNYRYPKTDLHENDFKASVHLAMEIKEQYRNISKSDGFRLNTNKIVRAI